MYFPGTNRFGSPQPIPVVKRKMLASLSC